MRIGVIGSGAIGCLVAAYLKLEGGEDVTLSAGTGSVEAIRRGGLKISGVAERPQRRDQDFRTVELFPGAGYTGNQDPRILSGR
jgi:ketopantoate reductase